MKQKIGKAMIVVAAILIVTSCIFLYKGFDKKNNYKYSEYSLIEDVNAYVGGDAYNYIINGTYFTGFVVLAGFAFIGACIFCVVGIYFYFIDETIKDNQVSISSFPSVAEEKLPEI